MGEFGTGSGGRFVVGVWIEQARQRIEELIGTGVDPSVIIGELVVLVLVPVLVVAVVVSLRRRRRWRRGRGGGVGTTGADQAQAGNRDDIGPRAMALVAETIEALKSGPHAEVMAFRRAERIEEQGRHLFHAVNALLCLSDGWSRSARAIEPALAALATGDTGPATHLLGSLAGAMSADDGGDPASGAQLLRHLAAVTFLREPPQALAPAQKAADLAPAQPLGWSLLGIVAEDLKEHEQAKDACETVLKLGSGSGGQGLLAGAVGTLGEIYLAQGKLERAEESFRIALTYQAGLARPESMVRHYRGLAQVEMARGDWARSAEIVEKAIVLEVALGHREGIADLELQAALIAQRRGDLSGALARWAKARQLYLATGATEKVQALDRLIARVVKK